MDMLIKEFQTTKTITTKTTIIATNRHQELQRQQSQRQSRERIHQKRKDLTHHATTVYPKEFQSQKEAVTRNMNANSRMASTHGGRDNLHKHRLLPRQHRPLLRLQAELTRALIQQLIRERTTPNPQKNKGRMQ